VTPIWLRAEVMKVRTFSPGSTVVVDKMKRRRVANAIRNFIWVDGKNEITSHPFKFFFGEDASCQDLASILDIIGSFMPHLVLPGVEHHARQLRSRQFFLSHDKRNDKDLQ